MYRSSPFRSTLNMGYITGLDMCKVCTEAVHSVALWTRVTLGLDMCACTEPLKTQKSARRHTASISTRLQQLRFHNQNAGFNNHSPGTDSRTIVSITNKMETVMLSTPHPPHPTLGFWIRLFWLLNPWLLMWLLNPGFWLLNPCCWRLWLLNPGFWLLNPALLVVEALVVESFGCWNRLFWLLKPLLNPAVLVVESGFFGCWSHGCWIRLFWLLNPAFLVVESGFVGCWSLGCWMFWLLIPALLVVEAMVVESGVLVVEP